MFVAFLSFFLSADVTIVWRCEQRDECRIMVGMVMKSWRMNFGGCKFNWNMGRGLGALWLGKVNFR